MVIQSAARSYEIIRTWEGKKEWADWSSAKAEGKEYALIRVKGEEEIRRLIPLLSEIENSGSAEELKEYFADGEALVAVFAAKKGKTFKEWVQGGETGREPDSLTRFLLGQKIMESLILRDFPDFLLLQAASLEHIGVDEKGEPFFLFSPEEWEVSPEDPGRLLTERLKGMAAFLLQEERERGLYPELKDLLPDEKGEKEEADQTKSCQEILLGYYEKYMAFLPVLMENRTLQETPEPSEPEPKKPAFFQTLIFNKKFWKILGKLTAAVLLLFLLYRFLPPLWEKVIFPYLESRYLVKTMAEEGKERENYTGEVRLTDGEGQMIWRGRLENGRREGYGTEYDSSGQILYEGTYEKNKRSGQGILYEKDGNIRYMGGFLMGRYDGEGKLYQDGKLIYSGGFSLGDMSGEGEGILYDSNGRIAYEGGLKSGKRQGKGTAYENGQLIYEGDFNNDKYEGEGRLYSPNTGGLIYEGGFQKGWLSGEGCLYEPATGYLLYEGGFRQGEFDGEGREYDMESNLMYEGNFRLGVYHGRGTYYDTETGQVLLDGEFKNGVFVMPAELLGENQWNVATEAQARYMEEKIPEEILGREIDDRKYQ